MLCNRSKLQMQRINACYKQKYEKSLVEEVKDECSGDYETFLVSMLSDPVEDDANWLHKARPAPSSIARLFPVLQYLLESALTARGAQTWC